MTMEAEIAAFDASIDVDVSEATPDDWSQIIDKSARRWLGISGAEFVARWNAGEFADDQRTEVTKVALLLPSSE